MPESTQDMGLVTTFIAEAIGKPGKRTFRLILGSDAGTALIWLEKEQLLELSIHLRRTTGMFEERDRTPTPNQSLPGPETPIVEFKLGKQAIEFDEERSVFRFWNYDAEDESDVAALVFEATIEQVGHFSDESLKVCSSGRPICQLCHQPIDPDGHFCARSNGHPINAVERLQ